MFCHKCGNQVAEGAGFCHKCGAKLANLDTNQQANIGSVAPSAPPASVSSAPASSGSDSSAPMTPEEAYEALKNSAVQCPTIKEFALNKTKGFTQKTTLGANAMALMVKGRFYKYMYGTHAIIGRPHVLIVRSWLLNIILFPLMIFDMGFIGSFIAGEYNVVLSAACLVGCIIWLPTIYFAYKESSSIISHMNSTFYIIVKTPSKGMLAFSIIYNVIIVVLCLVSFVM